MTEATLDILLKSGSPAEHRMRQRLEQLVRTYDLRDWCFTNVIEVTEGSWPHSHPILTMNTDYEQDEMMALAEFVHEQLHWFEEAHQERRDWAIEETREHYPSVPSERPEGAGDEASTRLHLLVCYLEYQALKCLVGDDRARRIIEALSHHHYEWVYRTVLADEPTIAAVIRRHDLVPEPLRGRTV